MSVSRRTGFNSLVLPVVMVMVWRNEPQSTIRFALLYLTCLFFAHSLLQLVGLRKEVHAVCPILARKALALLQALEHLDDQFVLILDNHTIDDLENTNQNLVDLGFLTQLPVRSSATLALHRGHRSCSYVAFLCGVFLAKMPAASLTLRGGRTAKSEATGVPCTGKEDTAYNSSWGTLRICRTRIASVMAIERSKLPLLASVSKVLKARSESSKSCSVTASIPTTLRPCRCTKAALTAALHASSFMIMFVLVNALIAGTPTPRRAVRR
mmetsp:Transcript_49330/g.111887  ORF Transcript_49330/g.111887 Transcript_49330/m.111887 type:complete len:268 (+) Transcript_49330:809-1612(+)